MAYRNGNHARGHVVGLILVFSLLMYAGLGAQAHDSGLVIEQEDGMQIQYLEIVTKELDETCAALEAVHGVTFGEPVAALGNARTATLAGGGKIGVRAPMRETETPVVRPYLLVDDIEGAVKAAEAKGATIAIPPMELPGQGTFAIYILGGIEHGLWKN